MRLMSKYKMTFPSFPFFSLSFREMIITRVLDDAEAVTALQFIASAHNDVGPTCLRDIAVTDCE